MPETHLPHNHGQALESTFDHMPRTDDFQTVADVFKLLSDGSRIRIFWLLCHCEECVINLSAMVQMSSPAVSQTACLQLLQMMRHSRTAHLDHRRKVNETFLTMTQ